MLKVRLFLVPRRQALAWVRLKVMSRKGVHLVEHTETDYAQEWNDGIRDEEMLDNCFFN